MCQSEIENFFSPPAPSNTNSTSSGVNPKERSEIGSVYTSKGKSSKFNLLLSVA